MSALRSERQIAAMVGSNVDGTRQRDDFYPTPPELTRALLAVERFDGPIWEPACGAGDISEVLVAAGHAVVSSDLVDRGYGDSRRDFLMEPMRARHIITNPPFKLGGQFWRHACAITLHGKVAFLARITWLESTERAAMFRRWPPARVWICPWRPRMQKGRLATKDDTSGMMGFAWYVRDPTHEGPPHLGWLTRPAA